MVVKISGKKIVKKIENSKIQNSAFVGFIEKKIQDKF